MPHGNGFFGNRKRKTEFFGQKVYFEPLAIFGGTTVYFLLEDPEDSDDDNDPAQVLESDTYASADAAEVLALERIFIDPFADVRQVRNHAVCRCLVEAGLNARITKVKMTLGKYNMSTGVFTAIGTETQPTNFSNMDGAQSRQIRAVIDDVVATSLASNERIAFRVRVYGYRTAGGVTVPITLFFRRGQGDTMVETDTVKEEV